MSDLFFPTPEQIREAEEEQNIDLRGKKVSNPEILTVVGEIQGEKDWINRGRVRWELWIDGTQVDSGIAGTGGVFSAPRAEIPNGSGSQVTVTIRLPDQGIEETQTVPVDSKGGTYKGDPWNAVFDIHGAGEAAPADLNVTTLTTTSVRPAVGDVVQLHVRGSNVGDGPAAGQSIPIKANGSTIREDAVVTAQPGEEFEQIAEWEPSSPGTHTLKAAGETTTVEVQPATGGGGGSLPSGSASPDVLLAGAVGFLAIWWWSEQ
jgi:hypothetical protein